MALEDRIRASVDQALQSLATDLLSISRDEAETQVGEAEQRLRAEFDERLAEIEARHREQSAVELRAAVDAEGARVSAEAEQRFQTELQAAVQAASAQQIDEAAQRFDDRLKAAVAEAEARAGAAAEASISAARVGERQLEMAGMTRLVESIRGLDGATSLSEVLDALALAAGRETARAAVVVIKGEHVVGWRLSGFGTRDAQPKSVDLPIHEAGVIGIAATSARVAATQDGEVDGPGFEHLPPERRGLAVPVLVGGRVVAVVYADGLHGAGPETHEIPSPWPEAVEVLARHAGRCLEALTAQKAGSSGASSKLGGSQSVAPPASASPSGAAPMGTMG
ncbi:MAG: hypothetical protein OEW19_03245 [Acidobacteriota bacterium]|nr:hypothetical protein [Acidobacteriota bacterium]